MDMVWGVGVAVKSGGFGNRLWDFWLWALRLWIQVVRLPNTELTPRVPKKPRSPKAQSLKPRA